MDILSWVAAFYSERQANAYIHIFKTKSQINLSAETVVTNGSITKPYSPYFNIIIENLMKSVQMKNCEVLKINLKKGVKLETFWIEFDM